MDHVQATGDGCSFKGNAVDYILMGETGRGTSRTYEGINMVPAAQTVSNFYPRFWLEIWVLVQLPGGLAVISQVQHSFHGTWGTFGPRDQLLQHFREKT